MLKITSQFLLAIKAMPVYSSNELYKGYDTMTDKLFHITSKKFILILSLYFSFILNITLWNYLYKELDFSQTSVIIAAAIMPLIIFTPLYLLFNIITIPYLGKLIIVILLVASASADYAMSNLGVVINSDMMRNFAETNTREAMDLVTSHAIIYVLILGVLPAIWVILSKIEYSPLKKELKSRILCCLAVIGLTVALVPISYKEYVSFGRNHKVVRHYMNTFNYVFAYTRYMKKQRVKSHDFVILDNKPVINKKADAKPRVLVYLVGETARENNFSLYGYEKKTNPKLETQDIIIFKNVTSCGTATTVSLPCMFSHQTRDNFKLSAASYTQNILDIVKQAGYDVYWKDNDDGCKDVCNRVENVDAKDGNKQPFCFGRYCQDDILLDGLYERIANIKKDTVIVLHMMGSHGPTYYRRYPKEFDTFKPSCDSADLKDCTQEQIINTYDNTILYTDYVVSSTIDILKQFPNLASAVLYVSDHGESLGENNIYLHGLPYAIAPKEQKSIPMLIWLSDAIKQDLDIDIAKIKANAAQKEHSHDNLFHSILHLLSVETTVAKDERTALDVFN